MSIAISPTSAIPSDSTPQPSFASLASVPTFLYPVSSTTMPSPAPVFSSLITLASSFGTDSSAASRCSRAFSIKLYPAPASVDLTAHGYSGSNLAYREVSPANPCRKALSNASLFVHYLLLSSLWFVPTLAEYVS